jgi:hypothetical protein
VLVNEIANLIRICAPDAQAPKCPVVRTEQGSGGEQKTRLVEVSEVRHVLVLKGA